MGGDYGIDTLVKTDPCTHTHTHTIYTYICVCVHACACVKSTNYNNLILE